MSFEIYDCVVSALDGADAAAHNKTLISGHGHSELCVILCRQLIVILVRNYAGCWETVIPVHRRIFHSKWRNGICRYCECVNEEHTDTYQPTIVMPEMPLSMD